MPFPLANIHVRFLIVGVTLIGIVLMASSIPWRFAAAAKAGLTTAEVTAPSETSFVRKVDVISNDVIVDPITQTIYVSTPSSALQNGNSIVPVTGSTGVVGTPVFVGSEPRKMAVSDNGQYIYVNLEGAAAIRRFDIASQTAGLQFALGKDFQNTPLVARDFAVQPSSPDTVAVLRQTQNGGSSAIAVYHLGVPLSTTVNAFDYAITFSTSNVSRLYGASFGTGSLRRMNINSDGVVQAGTTPFSGSGSIRFDNGRLYTSSGTVVDPETGTLFGTFSGTNITSQTPFITDSTLNRAFYLTAPGSGPQTLTLRVFDQQAFVPVGTLDIPNVLGAPTRIVRWGSNGLAFSTTAGELYIVQSTLVSSVDPIPTPTPTPTGTPTPLPTPPVEQAFTRQVDLRAGDIVFDPGTQKIFASVSSIAGAGGNSVTPIDVQNATIGIPVFVGSEPNKLARSDDGQFLYVSLDGAAAVRRVNIASQTADLKFSLGSGSFEGPFYVEDMEVSPGEPTVVAVSRRNQGFSPKHEGVAIYDNGVQRGTTTPDHTGSNVIEYSATPGTLYGFNNETTEFGFRKMSVTSLGVSVTNTTTGIVSTFGNGIQFDSGRVYFNGGQIIDPESATIIGTFNNIGFGNIVAPDASVGRAFFIDGATLPDTGINSVSIRAFDTNTFVPVGSLTIAGVRGRVLTLIRWGVDGLAFCTSGGQIFLIQSSLVVPQSTATPTPTPTPTATPTPTPVATPGPNELRQIALTTNDLVTVPGSETIFASVPSSVGASGNSLTPINAAAATVGQSVFVGSEPNKLAISSEGQKIYVGLDGASAVRPFDVPTLTPGVQFSLGSDPFFGPFRAEDMAVAPGQPGVLAVSLLRANVSPRHGGVAVFDNGVQRQLKTADHTGSNVIEFSNSPEVLYGQNNETTEFGFRRMAVAQCGVVTVRTTQNLFGGFGGDFRYDNGIAYANFGRAVDPEAVSIAGTFVLRDPGSFAFTSPLVLPDAGAGRVYFVVEDGGSVFLRVFDIKTFLRLGEVRLPGVSGTLTSLVRWGANGVAFRNTAGKVFLLQNSLIGGNDPAFTPAPLPATPTLTFTVNISSFNGDPSGVTVNVTGGATTSGTTDSMGRLSLGGLPPCGNFTITPSKTNYTFSPASVTVSSPTTGQNINFTATLKTVGFNSTSTNVSESATKVTVLVTRNFSTSPAAVNYETVAGTASDRSDFNTTLGTLQFASGELSKFITVLLNNDTLVEGPEAFTVILKDPSEGVLTSGFSTITVNITDNDTQPGALNPLNDVAFFVRQHYTDFLNREPDAPGLAFWMDQITSCPDSQCREIRRINVSAAFFLAIEFQETGYFVYRMNKAGFGNLPGAPVPVRFTDFLRDSQLIAQGVQVGVGNWQAQLEANKQAFTLAFVQRSEFLAAFPNTMTATQFVDQLNTNAGGALSPGERDTLIATLTTPADVTQRAAVMRAVSDDADLRNAELNKAFVLTQYFGYLRRNPNDAPNTNFDGWQFWLNKLNEFNGNFVQADMVKSFLVSGEYQLRFGAANFNLSQ